MKRFLIFTFLFISLIGFGQNHQLAQNYFDKGEYEKALISYEELYKNQPRNTLFFTRVIECHQQLQNFEQAEKLLQKEFNTSQRPQLLVDLGYNFKLQKNEKEAEKIYEKAIGTIEKSPSNVFSLAQRFDQKGLYDYALRCYEKAQSLDPKLNFNYQIGVLYGQTGKTDLMIEKFLDESFSNQNSLQIIQNQFSRFMNDNPDENFTISLRKSLIQRAQKDQDPFWNSYLSWFYTNQKDYGKAFVQEKAIYRRNPDNFHNIVNLAEIAIQDKDMENAQEIIQFVLENTSDHALQIFCHNFLYTNKIKNSSAIDYPTIKENLELDVKKYGTNPTAIPLHITYAQFLTFNLDKPEEGKKVLNELLKLNLNDFHEAEIKMELADIFLFEEKFNQASLLYNQIETNLKNNAIAHEASLKSAKTSYFKADFDWALNQFKILKSATSQLIANDALEYFLLINDNKVSDSTMVALKKFAKADYLLYKNKNAEALTEFQKILTEDKENEIISVTLLRIGQTYERLNRPMEALDYYKQIIDRYHEGIYVDEAYYFSAEIYFKNFKNNEQAKPLYEKILFDHQDSIYYIDSQKKYRQIRGDFNS